MKKETTFVQSVSLCMLNITLNKSKDTLSHFAYHLRTTVENRTEYSKSLFTYFS